MRVMKFGGTSLSAPERLETVCRLVGEARGKEPVVLVTSALAGVTDLLIEVASGPGGSSSGSSLCSEGSGNGPMLASPVPALRKLHLNLWEALVPGTSAGDPETPGTRFRAGLDGRLEGIASLFSAATGRGEWNAPTRDRFLGSGDRMAAHLVASILRAKGVPAVPLDGGRVIRTDSTFGEARVDLAETLRLARNTVRGLPDETVPVVAGFTGEDAKGRPTTLGRGSSDLTAALLAAALSARVVEIWTDVDGIHQEDPWKVPGSPVLPRLSYQEARAMARNGAKVLHPRTLDPVERKGIPLRVLNTLDPSRPGTLVGPAGDERGVSAPITPAGEEARIPVRVVLAGATGGVGKAFLRQLTALSPSLSKEGIEVRVAGAFSSRAQFWRPEGVPLETIPGSLVPESPPDWKGLARRLASESLRNPVFVDCTASPEVSGRYLEILSAGIPLVTPNKLALSGELAGYRALIETARRKGSPCRYETTVGAALPILGTIRELRRRGDRIRRVAGVLSGTLSFVFGKLAEGAPFSQAVRSARDLGCTEPHPREDLLGHDVGRKLLILLREAGFEVEPRAIPVESLVPDYLANEEDPERFLDGLAAADPAWAARIEGAAGKRLSYLAWFDGEQGGVGVESLPPDHPLAALRPTENMVALTTDHYSEVPLTIAGPGAGPEVTASGVLSDFLAAVAERYGPIGRRVA